MSENKPKKNPRQRASYLDKPVDQMTWHECQKYIKHLLREQIQMDKFIERAYRALEKIMP